jgi:hypothetical protein
MELFPFKKVDTWVTLPTCEDNLQKDIIKDAFETGVF